MSVEDEGDLAFYVVLPCPPLAIAPSPYRRPPRIVPVNDVRHPTSFGPLGDTAQTDSRPLLGPAQTKPRFCSGLEGRVEYFSKRPLRPLTGRRLASRPNLQISVHELICLKLSTPSISTRDLTTSPAEPLEASWSKSGSKLVPLRPSWQLVMLRVHPHWGLRVARLLPVSCNWFESQRRCRRE